MSWLVPGLAVAAGLYVVYRHWRYQQEIDRGYVSAGWIKELSEGRKEGVTAKPEPMYYQEERRGLK